MKVAVNVLNSADTAVLLRVRLGPIRSWPDFLADCIRAKQELHGCRLMPCCRKRDRHGFRPHYSLPDIEEFILNIKTADATAGRAPIKPSTVVIDTSRGWRLNRVDRSGALMARHPGYMTGGGHHV
jgi:hypothetical protein